MACADTATTQAPARGAAPIAGSKAGAGTSAPPVTDTPAGAPAQDGPTKTAQIAPNSNLPNVPADGTASTCQVVQLVAEPIIPDMLIVLDRSGSMGESGRWEPSVSAVRSLTTQLQSKIHFGLALFPDPGTSSSNCIMSGGISICINGSTSAAVCAPGKIVVPVAADTATKIGGVLNMTLPSGGTPTSDTLQRVLMDYGNAPSGPDDKVAPKYVLLVTDGLPTCPAGAGEETTPPDVNAANTMVEQLAAKKVKTYVIGYDTSGADNAMLASVLDGFAQRGGTGDMKHRPVEDEMSLLSEFTRITNAITSCRLALNAPPQRPDYVLVRLDGKQINLNDPDGFKLIEDNKTVELTGAACARFREGTHLLDAQVQCSVVQPM